MPYKCLQCNKVVNTKGEQECDCNSPNFVKCETIHFLHKDGIGKATARRKTKVGTPPNVKIVDEVLRVACATTNPSPIVTSYAPTITCPDCLAYIKSIRPAKEEEEESSAAHPVTTTTDNPSGNPSPSEINEVSKDEPSDTEDDPDTDALDIDDIPDTDADESDPE